MVKIQRSEVREEGEEEVGDRRSEVGGRRSAKRESRRSDVGEKMKSVEPRIYANEEG